MIVQRVRIDGATVTVDLEVNGCCLSRLPKNPLTKQMQLIFR